MNIFEQNYLKARSVYSETESRERFISIFGGDDPDAILAAYLHDSIEDGYVTEGELRGEGVSEKTIRLVKILTHGSESYEDYIKKVKQDKTALLIKIADILDNLSDKPTVKQIKKYSAALFELTS